MYIPSVVDGLKKYSGGTVIEQVGGGDTQPGAFRVLVYMKEIDRMFGISDNAVYGQITWSNLPTDPQPDILVRTIVCPLNPPDNTAVINNPVLTQATDNPLPANIAFIEAAIVAFDCP